VSHVPEIKSMVKTGSLKLRLSGLIAVVKLD